MLLLDNPVQAYAWGRPDGMQHLVGSAASGGPEAELWVGSHPVAPSMAANSGRRLDDLMAAEPARWLGRDLARAGHRALPFLLKVLAIGRPLSLQAHPTETQAREGFAAEEAAGLPLDAPARCFRDPNGKPEALVALEPTWAMAGFRPAREAAALLEAVAVPALGPVLAAVRAGGTHAGLGTLLRLDEARRAEVAAAVTAAVGPAPADGWASLRPDDPAAARAAVALLAEAYPNDPTVVAPLLLATFRLDAGEAVFLPPGQLHAYLDGAGVEVMAASDNVLRGGLTPKHVDVDALLRVVAPHEGGPCRITPAAGDGCFTYDLAPTGFRLGVCRPGADLRRLPLLDIDGPALLLPTGGPVTVTDRHGVTLALGAGQGALVPPGHGPLVVDGPGSLWWASGGAAVDRLVQPGAVTEHVAAPAATA